jgi:hypothetical protein
VEMQGSTQREFLLALWTRGRLAERDTVSWAIDTLAKIRGDIGGESALLFKTLEKAAQSAEIPTPFKTLWQLFHKVARESIYREDFVSIFEFKDNLRSGNLSREDIDGLVERLRPRLKAKAPTRWGTSPADSIDDPLEWVNWTFETALHATYQREARPTLSDLSHLSSDVLFRILERGTNALRDAMDDARQIGWIKDGRDLPNLFVRRVFVAENEQAIEGDEDGDVYDPDESSDSLAPITRLLSESFEALSKIDINRRRIVSESWRTQSSGLFLRLFAVTAWKPEVQNGPSVAITLQDLRDEVFWLWDSYPEIASLRAVRWADLPADARKSIGIRLLNGPPLRDAGEDAATAQSQIQYRRDHELSRIVDAGQDVPDEFHRLVEFRRETDPNFPKFVSAIESGLPAVRVSWGSDGNADVFKDVPITGLLARLTAPGSGRFGERDDAEALTKSIEGKRRIVEALALASTTTVRQSRHGSSCSLTVT